MLIVGLTGSIGMGKSTTAQIFRDLGAPVHDSDAAVHEIYRTTAREPVRALFPGAVDGDGVNRAKLASIVLADTSALKRLEGMVHPLVAEHRRQFIQACAKTGASLVVCDIPLLFETGADSHVDLTIVVTASAAVQKARVMARPGMTAERFSAIMDKQMPDAEKRRRGHVVIDTGRGIPAARRQVEDLLRALSARAHAV
ncbi:MAG: dephospho-CoA kinase [Hyphomicrobiales bacterium]|nr:dephospho-CoA kinase [Hyphomicrobiales bacterium]